MILTFAHPALPRWALCCPGVSVASYRTRRRSGLLTDALLGILLGVAGAVVVMLALMWMALTWWPFG